MPDRRTLNPFCRRAPLLLLPALAAACLAASAQQRSPAFEQAAQMRQELRSIPRPQRTRADYERVLVAYRALYVNDPGSADAPESVDVLAGLLAEEGRAFHDESALLNAIGQYELLRQQYPQSAFCGSALLHQGEIYWQDLHDSGAAATAFQEFLRVYPDSQFAGVVRTDLHRLGEGAGAPLASEHPRETRSAVRTIPPPLGRPIITATSPPQAARNAPQAAAVPAALRQPPAPSGPPALVTGLRHWSTPDYTRVAIDLGQQVQYEAARVPNPDRIYFDLHNARLASALSGRSVPVTDGGFLKRIRVAQFSNDVTRVVLDVSQVSEYSAFFLPNPWRLIIDVHGRGSGSAPAFEAASTRDSANPPAEQQPTENRTGTAANPGRRAASSLREIASLGNQPDRVKATAQPTTGPIAASVAGVPRTPQPARAIALSPASATASVATAGGERVTPAPATLPAAGAAADTTVIVTAPATRKTKSGRTPPALDETEPTPTHEAEPTADGQRSLVRALGLKIGRIVVDAGHGGHDSGTLGPEGVQEKEVVLDVALRLGKLLKQRLGADVIYTRDNDTFVPLETRTAIANKAQADLFISVHANSSPDPGARGVETYYLNFTTSPDALEVAARENAVSDQSIHELSDLVKKITLKDKIDESREFASDVESSLYSGLESGNPGLRDRGVKKAPFVVLIGANMPSILAEISFLTNPNDASELHSPAYRERIAESLYRGIERYIRGLSGLRLAQASTRTTGGR